MPKLETQKHAARKILGTGDAQYPGKQRRTGNFEGFRLDRAFFKRHSEFSDQEVNVTVIAPGRP